MSVDILISPRISFSHNIIQTEHGSSIPIETYPYSSPAIDTGFDFDFAFTVDSEGSLIREASTADELFSNGKLLPISSDSAPIQTANSPSPAFPCLDTEEEKRTIKSLKEHLEDGIDFEECGVGKAQSSVIRTFWKFTRSNSLNRAKFSIPSKLRLLSRSKSTASTKPTPPSPEPEVPSRRSSSFNWENRGGLIGSLKMIFRTEEVNARQFRMRRSCSFNCDDENNRGGGRLSSMRVLGRSKSAKEGGEQNSGWKKVKKGMGRKDYNGNSLLNLPSPYISRASVDLLGFGSFFSTKLSYA